jgi:hypothetical protein
MRRLAVMLLVVPLQASAAELPLPAAALSPSSSSSSSSSPLERCADLHRLWARYEWHFTLHSSQKARADLALERDCAVGRYAHGMDELHRLLQRGLIPMSRREVEAATIR